MYELVIFALVLCLKYMYWNGNKMLLLIVLRVFDPVLLLES